jgi:hypothetical protein
MDSQIIDVYLSLGPGPDDSSVVLYEKLSKDKAAVLAGLDFADIFLRIHRKRALVDKKFLHEVFTPWAKSF